MISGQQARGVICTAGDGNGINTYEVTVRDNPVEMHRQAMKTVGDNI